MSADRGAKPVKVSVLTREWPPAVYGGAGVHVTNLVDALKVMSLCFEIFLISKSLYVFIGITLS